MLFIRDCVEKKNSDGLIIKSRLYDSVVKITNKKMMEEYAVLKEKGCINIETALQKGLHEQGILLSEEEIMQIIEDTSEAQNNMYLILMPTDGCNFRCSYCYEEHDTKTMNISLTCAIEKFLERSAKNYGHITIEWFGGEPTLCKKDVISICKKACEVTGYDENRFRSSMTTNGYLLDVDAFLEYYKYGLRSYQITIDGWNHDQKRPLANGKGSLEQIIKNLDAIHALSDTYQFKITIRNNITADDLDFSWYDYLHQKYGQDNRFRIIICPVSDWGGESVKRMPLLTGNNRTRTLAQHKKYVESLGMLLEDKDENIEKGLGQAVCYAGMKNYFIIRADGRVQKCTLALEDSMNTIGYIDADGLMYIDEEKHKKWYCVPLESKCYSCKKLFSCMNGSCPRRRISGDFACQEYER